MIEMGFYSYGTPKVLNWGKKDFKVTVGNFSAIADNVVIMLRANHRSELKSQFPFPAYDEFNIRSFEYNHCRGDVKIGSDVWIGYGAIIMSGVEVGDGAVVGAGAIVTKSVRPYAVVVGSPAREIKRRFDDKTVERLLKEKWWYWPLDKIKAEVISLMSSP